MTVPAQVVKLARILELHVPEGTVTFRKTINLVTDAAGKKLFGVPGGRPASVGSTEPSGAKVLSKWNQYQKELRAQRVKVKGRVRMKKIGAVNMIVYRSDKFDGRTKDYYHEFKTPLPVLWGDNKLGLYELRGGRYRITGKGIEG